MVRTESPICDFDLPAVDFKLTGVDGKQHDLNSLQGPNGLLIMFICNHCPYVKSIINRIIRDASELHKLGINSVGIMSNDPNEYEEDSFENMKKIASDLNFPFPYLIDETQEVASLMVLFVHQIFLDTTKILVFSIGEDLMSPERNLLQMQNASYLKQ